MDKIFISYNNRDREFAKKIQVYLESIGFGVWIDEKEVLGGDLIFEKVIVGLVECNIIIAVLSNESIKSKWVKRELNRAMHYEVDDESCFVIPVRIEDCDIPISIIDKKYIDLFENFNLKIRDVVQQIDEQLGIEWSYPETPQFAEENLIYNLKRNRNYSSLAIDNGLAFYYTNNYSHISIDQIDIRIPDWANEILSQDLKNPSVDQLKQLIPRKFSEVADYLESRVSVGATGFYNCKVGVVKIEKPIKRFNQPLTLTVIPLSYWVVKEFNRRILRNPEDEILQRITKNNLEELTKFKEDVDFNCPSALYVELAILTADKQVCIVEKNPQLSVLAQSSRSKWSATIEEGFEWNKDIDLKNMKLNIASVIARCFHLELDVFEELVNDVRLTGIALEYTHLNTGIFGFCSMSINSGDLAEKIKLSEDFQLKYKFIPLKYIDIEYFKDQADAGSWHPTARLRLHSVKQWSKLVSEESK